ncbi:hypothetical protein G3T20_05675 [Bordetella hinzii]|uniref:HNH endonuclease n=1 Tax=Bordetella hinzii TaxID=103855 RepID=UPI0013EFF571|nr:HNH endonuclease [Bordetella hinzii]QII84233.1 hypothetical protein G3T20_05675 [Bordetella hinzii]
MPFKYPSLAERIIANTYLSDDSFYDGTPCWVWLGPRNSAGYGQISRRFKRGPRKGKVGNFLVHRVAVQELGGRRLTSRSVVMHLCNNPLCCNPAHLKGGTQRQNMKQCVADGRHFTPFRKAA